MNIQSLLLPRNTGILSFVEQFLKVLLVIALVGYVLPEYHDVFTLVSIVKIVIINFTIGIIKLTGLILFLPSWAR